MLFGSCFRVVPCISRARQLWVLRGLRRESIKRATRMTAITGDKKKTGAMMRREKNTCARSWQPGDPSCFRGSVAFRPILTDGLA